MPVVSKPFRGSGITTYVSGLTIGRPSPPVATWGDDVRMLTLCRSMLLDISESAPRRRIRTFWADPVRISAERKPLASASMPMKTATTSAMPSAVKAVETGRWIRLRAL